jgi:hypothetical protein
MVRRRAGALTKPINKLLTISAGVSVVGASSLAAAAAIAPTTGGNYAVNFRVLLSGVYENQ